GGMREAPSLRQGPRACHVSSSSDGASDSRRDNFEYSTKSGQRHGCVALLAPRAAHLGAPSRRPYPSDESGRVSWAWHKEVLLPADDENERTRARGDVMATTAGRRRTYWIVGEATPLLRERALALGQRGYDVSFHTDVDALQSVLETKRAAVVLV